MDGQAAGGARSLCAGESAPAAEWQLVKVTLAIAPAGQRSRWLTHADFRRGRRAGGAATTAAVELADRQDLSPHRDQRRTHGQAHERDTHERPPFLAVADFLAVLTGP